VQLDAGAITGRHHGNLRRTVLAGCGQHEYVVGSALETAIHKSLVVMRSYRTASGTAADSLFV
jgi:hypothetical protein